MIDYKSLTTDRKFFFIAGPCVVENEKITFDIAEKLKSISEKLNVSFIFKASYRKANRSNVNSFTGIGDIKALKIIKNIATQYNLPTITDIHLPEEAEIAAEYVDMLQIPAFLCRQSDLLVAAGNTGKIVNIKKGQFLSGDSMKFAVEKVRNTGNNQIMLTERGNSFGYSDLIIDFRNIPTMKKNNVPVIVDVTHSLQQPNQSAGVTGGQPEYIEIMSKAAIATGANGLFFETHPNPSLALSDGANMLPLKDVESLLEKIIPLYNLINNE
ncbi:MAG: 3-deoxy-8-phosphooctulonate synthase [Bacteroidetes bacterium GWE2_29_8]|nr:MAG: 3-deoxy-8-phosphooctulonate synthase [Bacteroidetes bacterium GWE2_29_8]OFY17621.1 MAG: 3-deoxy-8-phosphooctulonate synthase [Bacteroidetes bacterium GWF2_29_10]